MKATKLVMITALVSFALMSFATTELALSKNTISLKAAICNAELVKAMHSQINSTVFMKCDCSGTYTAQVTLKKTVYLISGSYAEWRAFFYVNIDVNVNPYSNAGKKTNPFSQANPFGKKGKKIIRIEPIGPMADKY